jgi:hypothetical protein
MCFLYVGAAPCLSEWDSTSEASTSSTIHPCHTCPATSTHGNPPARAASLVQIPRRCAARAVASLARAAASSSLKARHAVGEEATISSTTCDCCKTATAPATEVAPNPSATATSVSTWPRSCPGTNPGLVRALDRPARSPEDSASRRSSGAPAAAINPDAPPVSSNDLVHAAVRRSRNRRRRDWLARLIFFRNLADVLRFTSKVPFPWMVDDLDNRDHARSDGTFVPPGDISRTPLIDPVNS